MTENVAIPRVPRRDRTAAVLIAVLLALYCGSYLYLRLFNVEYSGDDLVVINVGSDADYPLESDSKAEKIASTVLAPIAWFEAMISGRTVHLK